MEFELTLSVIAFCSSAFVIAGFIDAIAGGGGLLTTPCLLLTGLPPHLALGTGKLAAMMGSLCALLSYLRSNLVVMKIAPVGFISSFLGSAFGAWLAMQIDSALLGKIIVFLLPVGLVLSLFAGKSRDAGGELPTRLLWLKVAVIGFTIGCYDGFFGPATGSFFIIVLNLFLNMNLVRASATTKVLNMASNAGGLATFASGGSVLYALGIPCAVGSIIGNLIGAQMAIRIGSKIVRKFLYVALSMLLITLVYRFFIAV